MPTTTSALSSALVADIEAKAAEYQVPQEACVTYADRFLIFYKKVRAQDCLSFLPVLALEVSRSWEAELGLQNYPQLIADLIAIVFQHTPIL